LCRLRDSARVFNGTVTDLDTPLRRLPLQGYDMADEIPQTHYSILTEQGTAEEQNESSVGEFPLFGEGMLSELPILPATGLELKQASGQ
jgi:hypothetical protein